MTTAVKHAATTRNSVARVSALDWHGISQEIDDQGSAVIASLLTPDECQGLADLYPDDTLFRSRVVMARHGFGRGEYKYFRYPLPDIIADLRTVLYSRLASLANRWSVATGVDVHYPERHDDFLERCHDAGQVLPTPLLLKYGPGDYNCLHQDLYGELVFPLQVTVLLSRPGEDFAGGEFLLVGQGPRRQSKGEVVALRQGDAVIFPVNHRPVAGTRGHYRVTMRHGVSRVRSGSRFTLG